MAITVSGTTITAGTAVSSGDAPSGSYNTHQHHATVYDETNNIGVWAYEGVYLGVRTISLSGTGNRTITLNTRVWAVSEGGLSPTKDSFAYDPSSEKCFLMYVDEANTDIDAVVISVSGTTVTAGTPAEIDAHSPFNGNVRGGIAANGSAQGGISIFWKNDNNYIRGAVATISDTSFSVANSADLNSEAIDSHQMSVAYKTTTRSNSVIYVSSASDELEQVTHVPNGTVTATNMPSDGESYIGIATKTVADDAQAEVATFGQIDAQQSGLTAGQKYFVQDDGTLGTSASSTATMVAGKALSATKLLISE